MIQRIALLAGGLGAAAVLAFALGLTNFAFTWPNGTQQTADTQPVAQAADTGATTPVADNSSTNGSSSQGAQTQTKRVVDKIYIAPTPPPEVIHQPGTKNQPTHTAPPAPPKPPAAAPSTHDDGAYDDGHEGQESERQNGHGHERGDD